MEKKIIIIGFLLLIVGLGFGYILPKTDSSFSGMYMMPNRSRLVGNIDQSFIEQMIPHHEGAIAMARLALTKSKRPEILSLAKDIIEAQQKEIVTMKVWYKDWYGKDVPEENSLTENYGMMMHMGSVSGDLDVLNGAKDFDLEFIRQMVPHHEMAIMMAQMLLASTERSEMKQLGSNIITSQSKEIQMMRDWFRTWSK